MGDSFMTDFFQSFEMKMWKSNEREKTFNRIPSNNPGNDKLIALQNACSAENTGNL